VAGRRAPKAQGATVARAGSSSIRACPNELQAEPCWRPDEAALDQPLLPALRAPRRAGRPMRAIARTGSTLPSPLRTCRRVR